MTPETDPADISPAAFVEAKATRSDCPFCGHDDWRYLSDLSALVGKTSDLEMALLEEPEADVAPLTTIPAIALNCFNCGFVRFHVHPTPE